MISSKAHCNKSSLVRLAGRDHCPQFFFSLHIQCMVYANPQKKLEVMFLLNLDSLFATLGFRDMEKEEKREGCIC